MSSLDLGIKDIECTTTHLKTAKDSQTFNVQKPSASPCSQIGHAKSSPVGMSCEKLMPVIVKEHEDENIKMSNLETMLLH